MADTFLSSSNGPKSSQVASILERKILANEYKVGQPLPSQKELAESFNVSSRSLREAFKSLEAKGLIEVSQGRKAIVKSNNLDRFVESLSASMFTNAKPDKRLLTDLLEFKINIETSAARNLSRDPERGLIVKSLQNYVDRMEGLLGRIENRSQEAYEEFKQLDFDLHVTIIKSNNNIILNTVFENLAPQLKIAMAEIKESYSEIKKKVNEYKYLVDSFRDGTTDLAVALTLVNATNTRTKFSELSI